MFAVNSSNFLKYFPIKRAKESFLELLSNHRLFLEQNYRLEHHAL